MIWQADEGRRAARRAARGCVPAHERSPAGRSPASRRRGSAYLVILGAATLLTILGLSGLLAVRIELRGARTGEAAAKARVAAASALELALLRVGSDDLWRKNYKHDVWTAEETVGEATCQFKVACQVDNSLLDHEGHPARLYAKARVGDATRVYSVLINDVEVELTDFTHNGDFESGAEGWDNVGWWDEAVCNLQAVTDPRPSGDLCLRVDNRASNYAGPMQDVTAVVEKGKDYTLTAWVRMIERADSAMFGLYVETTSGGVSPLYTRRGVTTEWTEVAATFTATWSGELDRAYIAFATQTTTQPFLVDKVVLTERDGGTALVIAPVPGTWRRESGL